MAWSVTNMGPCFSADAHATHVLSGAGKSVIATDVLWSDPSSEPGLMENEARGVGLLFGPDITQVKSPNQLCSGTTKNQTACASSSAGCHHRDCTVVHYAKTDAQLVLQPGCLVFKFL